jgi:hypothetical protein
MKIRSIILTLIIIFLLFAGMVFVGHMQLKTMQEFRESREFADSFVLALTKNWDTKEIVERASPELLEAFTRERRDEFVVLARGLGKLKKYNGAEHPFVEDVRDGVYAKYEADAEFDAGPAKFTIELIRHSDKWQLYNFHVAPNSRPK